MLLTYSSSLIPLYGPTFTNSFAVITMPPVNPLTCTNYHSCRNQHGTNLLPTKALREQRVTRLKMLTRPTKMTLWQQMDRMMTMQMMAEVILEA